MTEKLKPSRYNHFVDSGGGKRLAFNALTCGLAEIDDESFAVYQAMGNGGLGADAVEHEELIRNLKKGGFLIPADFDEMDGIRAAHYRSRFGNTGFGLTIIPTVNCNFACDYCYENSEIHSTPANQGGTMSDEVCDSLVRLCEERISEKSNFSVTWYGGEPLLGKSIIDKLTREFIRVCSTKLSEYRAGVITNGYLLTPENLEFLIDSRVGAVQVTIDGPPEIHDKRRCLKSGGPTYHVITKNLTRLSEEMPLSVTIRVNIDRRNQGAILPLLEDFKRRGFHQRRNLSLYFSQVMHYSNSCPDIAFHCMITKEFSRFMTSAYRTALDLGFRISVYPATQLQSCGAVTTSSGVIEPDGTVQPCWNTTGDRRKRIGVLTADGIQPHRNQAKWLAWSPFRGECEACAVLPVCMGGCPFHSVFPDELADSSQNTCTWWKYNLGPMLEIAQEAGKRGLLEARVGQIEAEVEV